MWLWTGVKQMLILCSRRNENPPARFAPFMATGVSTMIIQCLFGFKPPIAKEAFIVFAVVVEMGS